MKKKMMRAILVLMTMILVVLGHPVNARAQEALAVTQFSQFMTALQQIDAKEEPDANAGTAFIYEPGATIFVTGETGNGWYVVSYQGKTGYINKNSSQKVLEAVELDIEGLNAEMAAMEEESRLIIEVTERYRAEARRSKIWGTVIVLLVIGIFATGIISTVQAEKKKNKGENPAEKKDKVEEPTQVPTVKEEDDDILDLDKE